MLYLIEAKESTLSIFESDLLETYDISFARLYQLQQNRQSLTYNVCETFLIVAFEY